MQRVSEEGLFRILNLRDTSAREFCTQEINDVEQNRDAGRTGVPTIHVEEAVDIEEEAELSRVLHEDANANRPTGGSDQHGMQ